jgi:hypothetical protein
MPNQQQILADSFAPWQKEGVVAESKETNPDETELMNQ